MAMESKKQILIVEDEGLIALDIQQRLERMGYSESAIASSGEEALSYARSKPFDLILMDVRLQGEMDGITTAQALKEQSLAPVVYLTAHSDQGTVNRATPTEPFGYVIKPISDGSLRATVQTALYKAEMDRRVRASEVWLSTTLRNIGEAIIATDSNGTIVRMNPAAEELTGCSAQQAQGCTLTDVLQLWDESAAHPVRKVICPTPGEFGIYTIASPTGEIPVEVGYFENRTLTNEALGSILVLRDVRTRKELEVHQIRIQSMEAIVDVARKIANEFNDLLGDMLAHAEELCHKLPNAEGSLANKIRSAALLAISLNNQWLRLRTDEHAHIEVFDIDKLIREVQPLMAHCLGKDRTLTTSSVGSSGKYVSADRNQLTLVLLNLALDARDAMTEGGELRIEVSKVNFHPDTPESDGLWFSQYLRIRLTHCGARREGATTSQTSEPSSIKKDGSGDRRRFSAVHSIITRTLGHFSGESGPSEGTTFDIFLPYIDHSLVAKHYKLM